MLRHLRPSPATVIALIALFVALGGPAQAKRLLTGSDIKNESLTARDIKKRSLTGDRIRNGTLSDVKLTAKAIAALRITPDREVTEAKLADGAVTGAKVADGRLTGIDLAEGSLGQREIGDNGVGAREIADGAVDSGEIADGRQFVRDIASFYGVGDVNFGKPVEPGKCVGQVVGLTEISPIAGRARTVVDDSVLVTPEPAFDDRLVMSVSAYYDPQLTIQNEVEVTVCNPSQGETIQVNGVATAPDRNTIRVRVLTIDF